MEKAGMIGGLEKNLPTQKPHVFPRGYLSKLEEYPTDIQRLQYFLDVVIVYLHTGEGQKLLDTNKFTSQANTLPEKITVLEVNPEGASDARFASEIEKILGDVEDNAVKEFVSNLLAYLKASTIVDNLPDDLRSIIQRYLGGLAKNNAFPADEQQKYSELDNFWKPNRLSRNSISNIFISFSDFFYKQMKNPRTHKVPSEFSDFSHALIDSLKKDFNDGGKNTEYYMAKSKGRGYALVEHGGYDYGDKSLPEKIDVTRLAAATCRALIFDQLHGYLNNPEVMLSETMAEALKAWTIEYMNNDGKKEILHFAETAEPYEDKYGFKSKIEKLAETEGYEVEILYACLNAPTISGNLDDGMEVEGEPRPGEKNKFTVMRETLQKENVELYNYYQTNKLIPQNVSNELLYARNLCEKNNFSDLSEEISGLHAEFNYSTLEEMKSALKQDRPFSPDLGTKYIYSFSRQEKEDFVKKLEVVAEKTLIRLIEKNENIDRTSPLYNKDSDTIFE